MNSGLLALTLIPLLLICCTGPGLFLVARLRWSPMEKLCGAFAASYVVIYLASFLLFYLNSAPSAYWVAAVAFTAMNICAWRTTRLLLRNRRTRSVLLALLLVMAWEFLHLALVRSYGGGNWAVDWFEHFQRTEYFLHLHPDQFQFGGQYLLPARPPTMNLIAAFFIRLAGGSGVNFQVFSLVFLFLNACAFVPCCFFLGFAARRGYRAIPLLAALFMLNPSILQNTTVTVTKAMTAGLVVLGVCFYLRRRTVPAALSLAAAVLSHYSAAPFAAAVGLHCLYETLRRRRSISQTTIAAAGAAALLSTWLLWSISIFGISGTFNSGVGTTGMADSSFSSNAKRMAYNLFTSLVPHPLHPVFDHQFQHVHNLGDLRDYYFMMSQTTLPMMIGIAGGIIAIGLAARNLFWREPNHRAFWIFYILFTYILGIAVNYDWNSYGSAQVTMQSIAMMGLALVAANIPSMRPGMRAFLAAGLAIDYALGILLHFDRQSRLWQTAILPGKNFQIFPDPTLGHAGFGQYFAKLALGFTFWGDILGAYRGVMLTILVIAAAGAIVFVARYHRRDNANKNLPKIISSFSP